MVSVRNPWVRPLDISWTQKNHGEEGVIFVEVGGKVSLETRKGCQIFVDPRTPCLVVNLRLIL